MNLRRTLGEQRKENATNAEKSERTARLSLRELQSENQKLLEENQNLQDELLKQKSAAHDLTKELRIARSRNLELRSMNRSLLALLSPDEQTKLRELANIRAEINRSKVQAQSRSQKKPTESHPRTSGNPRQADTPRRSYATRNLPEANSANARPRRP